MTEDKRIDLTEFEGLFEPNLLLHVFEEIKKVGFKDQTTVWAAKMPPMYFGKQTVDAIEMLPELIAELKRMYEGVDALIAQLEIINKREINNEVDGNLIVDYLKRL